MDQLRLHFLWCVPLNESNVLRLPFANNFVEYIILAGSDRTPAEPIGKLQIFPVITTLAAADCEFRVARTNARKAALDFIGFQLPHDVHKRPSGTERRQ